MKNLSLYAKTSRNVLPCCYSCVRLSVTPWMAVRQAPLSMGFPRQEYWSGCNFLLQGIFPSQGPNSHRLHLLHWQAGSIPVAPREAPREI